MINFINNQKNTFLAITAMVVGVIFIDIHGLIVKYLGGEYSTIQLALFRNTFAIIPLILLIIYNKESTDLFKNLSKKFILFCFVRGSCFLAINILYYIAINNMEFATASTLTFSSTFFIVILSIFFLGDKVGIYRWSAVIIGFVGVVMIMRPNSSIFSYYSILPILVAFLWAVQVIILKFIPDNFSTGKIQFYSLFSSFLGSLIFIFFTTGHTYIETQSDFFILSLIGIFGGTAAILFIYSYRLIAASKIAVFEYLAIPSSFILAWIFFGEAPFDQLFPGVLLIVFAGLIIIWRDKNKKINKPN